MKKINLKELAKKVWFKIMIEVIVSLITAGIIGLVTV